MGEPENIVEGDAAEKKKKKKRNKKKKAENAGSDDEPQMMAEPEKYPLPYAKTGKHLKKTREQDNSHIVN